MALSKYVYIILFYYPETEGGCLENKIERKVK